MKHRAKQASVWSTTWAAEVAVLGQWQGHPEWWRQRGIEFSKPGSVVLEAQPELSSSSFLPVLSDFSHL